MGFPEVLSTALAACRCSLSKSHPVFLTSVVTVSQQTEQSFLTLPFTPCLRRVQDVFSSYLVSPAAGPSAKLSVQPTLFATKCGGKGAVVVSGPISTPSPWVASGSILLQPKET